MKRAQLYVVMFSELKGISLLSLGIRMVSGNLFVDKTITQSIVQILKSSGLNICYLANKIFPK